MGQGWREIAQSATGIDVIGNDLRYRQAYAGNPHVDAPIGLHRRCPEPGQVGLAVGVKPHRDDLTDVEAEGRCGGWRNHELVHPGGISRPACTDGQAVYPEVLATDASLAGPCLYRVRALADGGAGRAEGFGVDPRRTRHGRDVRGLRNLSDDGRVVPLPVADGEAGDRGGQEIWDGLVLSNRAE